MEDLLNLDASSNCMKDEDLQNFSTLDSEIIGLSSNSILYSFIQYIWDQKNGPCFVHVEKKFVSWLETKKIDLDKCGWYFSSVLDVRMKIINNVKFNEKISYKIDDANYSSICAKLAYNLRKELPMLINCKNDLNYTNDKGQTILHIFIRNLLAESRSISKKQRIRLRKLIENFMKNRASDWNINACDESGNTVLHLIVDNCIDEDAQHKNGLLDLIEIFVSNGADVNKQNNKGVTPIHIAARYFHIEILQLFAKNGARFHVYTSSYETPLHHACSSSVKLKDKFTILKTIKLLVTQGCPIDAIDERGYMALHCSAIYSTPDIIESLIELGAVVDCRTAITLLTPLYLATKYDRLNNMHILIRAGADVNAKAVDESTPIFMAVMFGSIEATEYLMSQEANIYQREKFSKLTLLHLSAYDEKVRSKITASEMDLIADCNYAEDEKLQKKFHIMIEKDFEIDDEGNCGITPLLLASMSRNADVVEILINRGANINFKNTVTGWTALHIALMKKNWDIVKILVEHGADVNCRGGVDQLSPLHLVAMDNASWDLGVYPDCIQNLDRSLALITNWWQHGSKDTLLSRSAEFAALLIQHGADVNARDSSGNSPLHLATLEPMVHVMDVILELGAKVNIQNVEGHLPLHNILKNGNEVGFFMLIEFGADINEVDVSQLIINNTEDIKDAAITHLIKCKVVNLPTAQTYESLIYDPSYEEVHELCLEELKVLKSYYINHFTLYQFLHMSLRRQYVYVPKILEISHLLKTKCPIYYIVLKSVCIQTINRISLIESSKIIWHEIFTTSLLDECIEHILHFLKNRHLEILVSGEKQDLKTTVGEKIVMKFSVSFY